MAGGAEQAVQDILARSALERQYLIISEAAIRLDKLDATLAPSLALDIDWPGIRGIGNFIRHKYDDLDAQLIIAVVQFRLDDLQSACELGLARLGGNQEGSV